MSSISPFRMISICFIIISNIMMNIAISDNTEDNFKATMIRCYNDIAQTMTDSDGDCNEEMNDFSEIMDDSFEYCAYFKTGQDQECVDKDGYISKMTDTGSNGLCSTYDIVTYYLTFGDFQENQFKQTFDAKEYSKPKNDNCVHILHEKVDIEYTETGKVHYVHETKDGETKICDPKYDHLEETSLSELSSSSGFTLITSPSNIDNVRAGLIMLDDEIRGLHPGWDLDSKPNSPQFIDGVYMSVNSNVNGYTFGGKVGYIDDSTTFIYVKFDLIDVNVELKDTKALFAGCGGYVRCWSCHCDD